LIRKDSEYEIFKDVKKCYLGGVNPARSNAFTLAEVLITLGIIGVVAAITIPLISQKVSHIILEKQFKKAYSEATQAVRLAKIELGVDKFGDYCSITNADYSYINANICSNAFINALKLSKKTTIVRNDDFSSFNLANSTNFKSATFLDCDGNLRKPYILSNGAYLGIKISCGNFIIGVDLNGARKPNRFGYDIFVFRINSSDNLVGSTPKSVSDEELESYKQKLEAENNTYKDYYYAKYGNPCNYTSSQKLNGFGCSYYALRNECPDGSGKGYFECLK
jgi:prepilin-type N-terminal cleavage/methylation domain-containing protein